MESTTKTDEIGYNVAYLLDGSKKKTTVVLPLVLSDAGEIRERIINALKSKHPDADNIFGVSYSTTALSL